MEAVKERERERKEEGYEDVKGEGTGRRGVREMNKGGCAGMEMKMIGAVTKGRDNGEACEGEAEEEEGGR